MPIDKIERGGGNVFGFEVKGKLTSEELQTFLPNIENAINHSKKKLRLLINVTEMEGANTKSEWEIFEFLKKHMEDIELIAIVGAHSWSKVMSEILTGSIFVEAETLYFKSNELEAAWSWLFNAAHSGNVPVRRVINSNKGLFTKYSSPDYI